MNTFGHIQYSYFRSYGTIGLIYKPEEKGQDSSSVCSFQVCGQWSCSWSSCMFESFRFDSCFRFGSFEIGLLAPFLFQIFVWKFPFWVLQERFCDSKAEFVPPETNNDLVVNLCIIFTACIAFLLYLDDVMRAFRKKRGLVILGLVILWKDGDKWLVWER